jgi:hypothetical protein
MKHTKGFPRFALGAYDSPNFYGSYALAFFGFLSQLLHPVCCGNEAVGFL